MTTELGRAAPDFTLRDQHGRATTLTTLRGRPVLLVFYPFAFSGVCTGELHALRDGGADRLRRAGAEVVAISCDPLFALRVFADRDSIDLPLLSDFWPHGEVARAYGAFDEQHGCPTRSSYLVDAGGTVRWVVHNPMGEARDLDEHVRAVEALAAAK